jgi:hypothetical protein
MVQVIEHLPSKNEALNSNLSTNKKWPKTTPPLKNPINEVHVYTWTSHAFPLSNGRAWKNPHHRVMST